MTQGFGGVGVVTRQLPRPRRCSLWLLVLAERRAETMSRRSLSSHLLLYLNLYFNSHAYYHCVNCGLFLRDGEARKDGSLRFGDSETEGCAIQVVI